MKKIILLVLLSSLAIKGSCISDRIKLGLAVSPGLSWMKPMGNYIQKGAVGYGMQYGVKFEYYFKDQNYGIATGLFGGIDGGGVKGRDTFTILTGGKTVIEKYNVNYISLPIYLKLKTNPIKDKFCLFGEVGFSMVFNITSRANFDQSIPGPYNGGALINISKENVLRNPNDVQLLIPDFHYHYFDFRLSVGGGVEYKIADRTSVFFAIHYNNGFIGTMNDKSVNAKSDAILTRNVLFSIGAMF